MQIEETHQVVVAAMETLPAGFALPLRVEAKGAGRGRTANEGVVNWLQTRLHGVGASCFVPPAAVVDQNSYQFDSMLFTNFVKAGQYRR